MALARLAMKKVEERVANCSSSRRFGNELLRRFASSSASEKSEGSEIAVSSSGGRRSRLFPRRRSRRSWPWRRNETNDLTDFTTPQLYDENKTPQNSEENELAMYLLSWILQLIKGKVWELIENFQSLVNDFFHSPKMQHVDPAVLHEKLRSSLLLCIVILLIVIMARLERS